MRALGRQIDRGRIARLDPPGLGRQGRLAHVAARGPDHQREVALVG